MLCDEVAPSFPACAPRGHDLACHRSRADASGLVANQTRRVPASDRERAAHGTVSPRHRTSNELEATLGPQAGRPECRLRYQENNRRSVSKRAKLRDTAGKVAYRRRRYHPFSRSAVAPSPVAFVVREDNVVMVCSPLGATAMRATSRCSSQRLRRHWRRPPVLHERISTTPQLSSSDGGPQWTSCVRSKSQSLRSGG